LRGTFLGLRSASLLNRLLLGCYNPHYGHINRGNMKTRESGMPDEQMWREFFIPDKILDALGVIKIAGNIVDFGCGYGTFSIPAAKRTKGKVYAIDIEDDMIQTTRSKADHDGLLNVSVIKRDFINEGTGLPNRCCVYAMLFNILHAEEPLKLLIEAGRILKKNGRVGIIHWNYDPATPRGPSMEIRPRPEQCQRWIQEAGFMVGGGIIALPPYHYGIVGKKGK
jgi:SAM-dependent methyltransferase